MLRRELKTGKAMHLVKCLVNKLASLICQKVHFRPNGGYLCHSTKFEWHFYAALQWYLDKVFGFPNKMILGNKLS